MERKQRIEVSPEMLTFVGTGIVDVERWPDDCVTLSYDCRSARLSYSGAGTPCAEGELVFAVQRNACLRLFGGVPAKDGAWHLPSDLRVIAEQIVECTAPEASRSTLRLAKSIELLCATFAALAGRDLVPATGIGGLSELDVARVAMAKRMVDELWHDKLTLDEVARGCGINRDKLARGFRALYSCTFADRLAENRLSAARRMLLNSDMPISSVAYRCGYLNNAAFARAFGRRYGLAPSQLRQGALAA